MENSIKTERAESASSVVVNGADLVALAHGGNREFIGEVSVFGVSVPVKRLTVAGAIWLYKKLCDQGDSEDGVDWLGYEYATRLYVIALLTDVELPEDEHLRIELAFTPGFYESITQLVLESNCGRLFESALRCSERYVAFCEKRDEAIAPMKMELADSVAAFERVARTIEDAFGGIGRGDLESAVKSLAGIKKVDEEALVSAIVQSASVRANNGVDA